MSRTKYHALFVLLCVTAALATGCQIVHVQNGEAKALFWAKVSPVSVDGTEGMPAFTDLLGNALLMKPSADDLGRLQISKDGYETMTVNRTAEDRIDVVLPQAGSTISPAAPMAPAPAPKQ